MGSTIENIFGKNYVIFHHISGYESKLLESDPELPATIKLELSSNSITTLESNFDKNEHSIIKKTKKTVGEIDKNSPTGMVYKFYDLENAIDKTEDVWTYRNPNLALPSGWSIHQMKHKMSSGQRFLIYEHTTGVRSLCIEADVDIPKE